jgi:ABC-2 type transport system ATP-binding protein
MKKVEIDAVYDELVAFSGVQNFIDSPVKHYSSGMFLRLAFSIIVHLNYDILLLDEVLAVGDESFRRKCAYRIQQIVSSGKTVVMVSHDLKSVIELCTLTALLKMDN